jgi:hypothetical protein
MACEICGRGSCSRSFHSFEAQEEFYYRPKDLDAALARVAELADAFNRVCAENADFVAESIKADRRIAELEAEVKTLRVDAERWNYAIENCMFECPNCVTPWKCNGPHITGGLEFTAHIDAAIDAERKGK